MDLLNTPTEDKVREISAEANPVLRNLQITESYYLLSEAVAARLGREANWCTFATWASKQAGNTIRKEDLANALSDHLGGEALLPVIEDFLERAARIGVRLKKNRLADIMLQTLDPKSAFSHSSEAVARGNRKVYAEIGLAFARFVACVPAGQPSDKETFERFAASLKPGPPPDGQELLRSAFKNYYDAMTVTDPKTRSERILLGNLQIGFHEQTRLQPDIVEALEAPVISPNQFVRNLLHAYYPEKAWLAETVLALIRFAGGLVGFDDFIERYLSGARRQGQHLVTRTLMTIEVPPHLRLRLGEDLKSVFPSELHTLSLPELDALLEKIDPTPDSLIGTGAVYWGDLPDRMHFIADFFRSFQLSEPLFDPPFNPQEKAKIEEGKIPAEI